MSEENKLTRLLDISSEITVLISKRRKGKKLTEREQYLSSFVDDYGRYMGAIMVLKKDTETDHN